MTATNQMSTTDEPPTEEPPRQPAIIRRRRNAVGPPDTSTERPLLAAATARRRLRSAQIDGGHRRRGWIDKRRSAVDVAAVIAALNALAATTVDRTGSADRATVDSAIRCRVASRLHAVDANFAAAGFTPLYCSPPSAAVTLCWLCPTAATAAPPPRTGLKICRLE